MNKALYYFIIPLMLISVSVHAQNTGIGTMKPTHTLHVVPKSSNPVQDPVRIENLQPYVPGTDSMVLVVDQDSGVLRVMPISALSGSGTTVDADSDPTNELQNSDEVPLANSLDLNGDGTQETTVQQALEAVSQRMPKGTFKSYGEARTAGLVDGDFFIAHPKGVLGCPGCLIELKPEMK